MTSSRHLNNPSVQVMCIGIAVYILKSGRPSIDFEIDIDIDIDMSIKRVLPSIDLSLRVPLILCSLVSQSNKKYWTKHNTKGEQPASGSSSEQEEAL